MKDVKGLFKEKDMIGPGPIYNNERVSIDPTFPGDFTLIDPTDGGPIQF